MVARRRLAGSAWLFLGWIGGCCMNYQLAPVQLPPLRPCTGQRVKAGAVFSCAVAAVLCYTSGLVGLCVGATACVQRRLCSGKNRDSFYPLLCAGLFSLRCPINRNSIKLLYSSMELAHVVLPFHVAGFVRWLRPAALKKTYKYLPSTIQALFFSSLILGKIFLKVFFALEFFLVD